MPNRRSFLSLVTGAAGASVAACLGTPPKAAPGRPPSRIRAVAFDAFPVLDPRPIFARVEESFPGKGAEVSATWRARQFEYTWLRSMSGRYADFWHITEDALVYAASAAHVDLSAAKRRELMDGYRSLKPWADAIPALQAMRSAGLRLAFLSNFTPEMLRSSIASAELGGLFEHVLSTDAARTYKPDPRAYQLGVEAFALSRDEIAFAAFAGWDAAGAKWFGYRTIWVNRLGVPEERLGAAPDDVVPSLAELARALA